MGCNERELYPAGNEEPWQGLRGGRENVRRGFGMITPVALGGDGLEETKPRDREDILIQGGW